MRFPTLLVLPAALAVPLAVRAADPSNMRPGLWEISVSMQVAGTPVNMPPTVTQRCVTSRDTEGLPPLGDDCVVSDMKQSGKRITWKVVCSGAMAGEGEGEVLFAGADAYTGQLKFETGGMVVRTDYRAKRLGECR